MKKNIVCLFVLISTSSFVGFSQENTTTPKVRRHLLSVGTMLIGHKTTGPLTLSSVDRRTSSFIPNVSSTGNISSINMYTDFNLGYRYNLNWGKKNRWYVGIRGLAFSSDEVVEINEVLLDNLKSKGIAKASFYSLSLAFSFDIIKKERFILRINYDIPFYAKLFSKIKVRVSGDNPSGSSESLDINNSVNWTMHTFSDGFFGGKGAWDFVWLLGKSKRNELGGSLYYGGAVKKGENATVYSSMGLEVYYGFRF